MDSLANVLKGDAMSGNDEVSRRFEGIRGILNDLRLMLGDMLAMGRPTPDQQMVIEVFFSVMGYLAKADRLVTSHESDLANRFMDELDLSMAARRVASEAFERGMHRNINLEGELLRFTDAHPPGSDETNRLYDMLVRLAASDERLDQREYDAMALITRSLGMPADTLYARLPRPTGR